MFKTLRNRLILSHILPTMIVTPLMGLAIIYTLETNYLLPSLSRDIQGDASILATFALAQKGVFDDPQNAQSFISKIPAVPSKRIMLFSGDGHLLASSDPADASRIDQILQISGLSEAESGKLVEKINYSQQFNCPFAENSG